MCQRERVSLIFVFPACGGEVCFVTSLDQASDGAAPLAWNGPANATRGEQRTLKCERALMPTH